MYLATFPNGGHDYWMVVRGVRHGAKVRQERPLYLGRLDNLTPERRAELERRVVTLHDDKVLHAFYAKLAEYGHPVPRPSLPGLSEEGPFALSSVDFATLCSALSDPDLTHRDLAAMIDRIGLPLRPEELAAVSVHVDLGEKKWSISLCYPRTSRPRPGSAPTAKVGSRPRRRSDGTPRASGPP